MIEFAGVIVVVLAVAIFLGIKTLNNLIYVCSPNEVLVFSGRARKTLEGRKGYRTIKGGRGIRVPLVEAVDKLDLTNMVIDVNVRGAYSLGGIPLNVQAVANVKIAGDEPFIHNALERLLGKSREQVMKIAKETLEGNLRGVLATLTPEQVNEDKMAFAQSMIEEAEHDLTQLGIVLDTLKIQNVTDDQGYLHAIGRKQSAELQKNAKIAEADATAASMVQSAKNDEATSLAQIVAQRQVATAEAERRIIDAKTQRGAVVAEQQSEVEALVARATAELNVQRARIEQARRQLQAEVIEPASARRDRMIYQAQGEAAKVVEDGRARAEALQQLSDLFAEQGGSAKQILMLQKLETLTDLIAGTVKPIDIGNITFIDGGATSTANDGSPPMKAISAVEQLRGATGIDVAGIAEALKGKKELPSLEEIGAVVVDGD